ncbi:MAG: proteasome-type protease [Paucimonas sp.]|jgi:putative proteasome-type protease|nr:proteasome-type protease [Paucimonas sp.]
MTYCVAMRVETGLVFLSDSRTNAGVDHIGTFRKMNVYENPGDRVIVLLASGNLSITQAIRQVIPEVVTPQGQTIWSVPSVYEAAQIVGEAIRRVHERDAAALQQFGIDFNVRLLLGGQVRGERHRLFHLYSAGNFIEAHDENPYFQIGEAKYGKPIIDRVITPQTTLDEAAKCALISMDSTLRSNISVGLPLDLLVYKADSFGITRFVTIDERNQYFSMIRNSWGSQLKTVFDGIADPIWDAPADAAANVLSTQQVQNQPVRMLAPAEFKPTLAAPVHLQSLAQENGPAGSA